MGWANVFFDQWLKLLTKIIIMRIAQLKPAMVIVFIITFTMADIGLSLSKPIPDHKIPAIHAINKQVFAFNDKGMEKLHFTLPFHLTDGYILIEGEVNNQSGKFMFDTGTPFSFFINNHFVPLTKDVYQSKGSANSGQAIIVYSQNNVDSVKITDQVRLQNIKSVPHANFGFIEEGVVQNYLGFIGHGFNKNYLFVIDYNNQIIDLFSLNNYSIELNNVFNQDRVVATLDFSSKDDGRIPEVEFMLGNETVIGKFDTGNQGTLTLTKSLK